MYILYFIYLLLTNEDSNGLYMMATLNNPAKHRWVQTDPLHTDFITHTHKHRVTHTHSEIHGSYSSSIVSF